MEGRPHHGVQQGGDDSSMYGAAQILEVLTRHQLRAHLAVRHGNAADAQHPREGWLRQPPLAYRLVHLQAGDTVHHPATPLGIDPSPPSTASSTASSH